MHHFLYSSLSISSLFTLPPKTDLQAVCSILDPQRLLPNIQVQIFVIAQEVYRACCRIVAQFVKAGVNREKFIFFGQQ